MGEGAAPKTEMQRGCGEGPGDRSRLFHQMETATPLVARSRGWGRDAQLGDSRRSGVGSRSSGSAPQQCGAGGLRAQSLYSAALGVPAPFPPQKPRLLASGPSDLIHMQIWRK